MKKHYPTIQEMSRAFTNMLRGVLSVIPELHAKYTYASMNINPMNVTVTQLVNYFNQIESLLTEFNTSQGYHSFLGVLQLGDPKNTKNGWKPQNPKANGANGGTDDGKGKKGKDGKDG
eukprot:3176007-Amphidinium_carterae.2